MKLVAEKLDKSGKYDRLKFVRSDASETQTVMPRQGTLPHDLVHYIVESQLPLQHGFLGLIAAGSDAGFVMQASHDHANPSITTEAVQTEAIVEALQAQLWSGHFDLAAFIDGVSTASAARGKPTFDFTGVDVKTVLYEAALELLERWNCVAHHTSMELRFR